MPSVLFVCVANSFRSQIAEAVARSVAPAAWEIWSAGSHPGTAVHPMAIRLLGELGLEPRGQRSKGLSEVPSREWDYVVTMGCNDACPTVQARRRLDWALPDPAGLPLEEARGIRNRIAALVRELCASAERQEAG